MRRLLVAALGALTVAAPRRPDTGADADARIFDPRRPPEREPKRGIADGFTLAAVGDLIISRPLTQTLPNDPGFAAVVRILQDADAAFGNFETTVVDPARVVGAPLPRTGRRLAGRRAGGRAGPRPHGIRRRLARQQPLHGLGSRGHARDHARAWTKPGSSTPASGRTAARRGPLATSNAVGPRRSRLDARRRSASMPRRWRRRGRAPGRPGLSPLRVTRSFVLTKDSMQQLRALKDTLGAPALRCEVPARRRLETARRPSATPERSVFWIRNSAWESRRPSTTR